MEFRILGPLEVWDAGRILALPGGKAKALLGILLLHANQVVSTDRLIDELWGGVPPKTATNALYVYVSELRKAFACGRGRPASGEPLVTRAPGYVLLAEPAQLDAARFEELVRESRAALATGDAAVAAQLLREALSLWRGAPLADFISEFATQPEIVRLEEEYLATIEDRIEADLALGLDGALVGELEALVTEHPLRERLREMLMRALYRSGRQAHALAFYKETRRTLLDEFGLEPSPALQRLEKAILLHDPSVDPPRLPARVTRESRRTITVLHADLSASLVSGEVVDPEIRREVVSRALETISHVVVRYEGTTATLVSDALLALYGVPRLHEDDALRAVRAAAEAREHVAALSRELERDRGIRIVSRLGVSTGEVMTTGALPVIGEPVKLAGKLALGAPPGGVVIDAATERLVRNAVRVEPAGRRASDVWLLRTVLKDAPWSARRLDIPMIGRDAELARLGEAFENVAQRKTAYRVTVLGPPGIGKSRLAREFRSMVADDATVVAGRCLPYGEGITFWPLAELVAQMAGDEPRAAIERLLAGEKESLLLTARIAGALGVGEDVGESDETFWAVRTLFERLARPRPLVAVFEDIQWAEATFLDLLEHVTELSRGSSILLLCLARPELVEDRPSWAGDGPNTATIWIDSLSREESAILIEHLSGATPLRESARAQLTDVAQGNPFFIEQMLVTLIEDGRPLAELSTTPTVQALLAAQLDRLEPEQRALLEHGAVVGDEFSYEAVSELTPQPLRRELSRHVDALTRKDLIRPAGLETALGSFRFRHLLVREAAYESLPKRARADSHERLADWLLRTADRRPYDELLGYHLEQAHRYRAELGIIDERTADLAARASERLAAAGRRAYDRYDVPAAVNLLSRAATLVKPGNVRAELLADLGEVLWDAGELQRARHTLEQAIDASEAFGDSVLAWRTRAVLLRLLDVVDPQARDLEAEAEPARHQLENLGDERGLANVWSLMGWITWQKCRAKEAEGPLQRAIEHARRGRSRRVEVEATGRWLGSALFGPLSVQEAIRRCEQILGEPPRHRRIEAGAYRALAVLRAMCGDFEDARELNSRAQSIIEDLGLRFFGAIASEGYGMVELLAGEARLAEMELRRGYETLEQMGEKAQLANVAAVLSQALYECGEYGQAVIFSEVSEDAAAKDDLSAQTQWRGPRAKVLARRGRTRRAKALATEAVAIAKQTDFLVMHADALMDLAEVQRLTGEQVRARRAAQEAVRLYARKGNVVSAGRGKVFLKALASDVRQVPRAVEGRVD